MAENVRAEEAVSRVVPARNEESGIAAMLTELVACLEDLPVSAREVLVVAGVQILALGAIADVINRWLH